MVPVFSAKRNQYNMILLTFRFYLFLIYKYLYTKKKDSWDRTFHSSVAIKPVRRYHGVMNIFFAIAVFSCLRFQRCLRRRVCDLCLLLSQIPRSLRSCTRRTDKKALLEETCPFHVNDIWCACLLPYLAVAPLKQAAAGLWNIDYDTLIQSAHQFLCSDKGERHQIVADVVPFLFYFFFFCNRLRQRQWTRLDLASSLSHEVTLTVARCTKRFLRIGSCCWE